MTGTDDSERAWAGDDIPVPDPPDELPVAPRAGVPLKPPDADAEPTFGPIDQAPASDEPSASWRRRPVVAGLIAAVAAVVAVGVVVVAVGGGGEEPASSEPADSTPPTTTDESADDDDATTSTTVEPGEREVAAVERLELALPPAVAAISEPTEVLMVTADGVVHTLSLPSGSVRSMRLGAGDDENVDEFYEGQNLVVSPDAAALAAGNRVLIVPRDGPTPVEVDIDRFDGDRSTGAGFDVASWTTGPDGQPRFLVGVYSDAGNPRIYSVTSDGTVAEVPAADPFLTSWWRGEFIATDGGSYINDAGGVYAIDADGSVRRLVDDGVLRAVSESSMLIRECTTDYLCSDVLVDRATDEGRPVADGILPDERNGSWFGLDLAPDGTAVAAIDQSASTSTLIVVDLTTGERIETPNRSWSRGSRWAADSSGVFELAVDGAGVEFLDRASGEAVRFADELGRVIALGVRTPDAELEPASNVTTVPITIDTAVPTPTDLAIVAYTRNGLVAEVDLDAGEARLWSGPQSVGIRNPSVFVVGDEVAVVSGRPTDEDASGYVAGPDGARLLPPDLVAGSPILAGPLPGTFWAPATTAVTSGSLSRDAVAAVEFVLLDLGRGGATEPAQSIVVPNARLLGGDGRGGVVVERGGDVYVATATGDSTGLDRLTVGELLAIGPDTAVVRECDVTSQCVVLRVDRLTGARSALAPGSILDGALGVDSAERQGAAMGSTVSPRGRLAVVRVPVAEGEPAWVLVDPVDGSLSWIDGFDGDVPLVWSADEDVAATVIGTDLVIVGTDGVATVGGLGAVRTIAPAPIVSGPAD